MTKEQINYLKSIKNFNTELVRIFCDNNLTIIPNKITAWDDNNELLVVSERDMYIGNSMVSGIYEIYIPYDFIQNMIFKK